MLMLVACLIQSQAMLLMQSKRSSPFRMVDFTSFFVFECIPSKLKALISRDGHLVRGGVSKKIKKVAGIRGGF